MDMPSYESEIENCERCKNNAVVQWKCVTCDHKICLNCKNFHAKIRTLQTHQIIPFEGTKSEVKNLTEKPPSSKTCDRCRSTRNVEWKCSDCNHLLCYHCKEFHPKIRRYQNHEIISLTNDTKVDTKQNERGSDKYCLEHPDQLLRAFCKDCDRQVCMKCATGEHNTHDIITMSNILEKQKQLADSIRQVKQKLAEMEKENKALRLKHRYSETFLSEITKKWEKGKKKDKKLKDLIDSATAEKEMVQRKQDSLVRGIEQLQTAIQNTEGKRYSRNYSELTNLMMNLESTLTKLEESDASILDLGNKSKKQEESNAETETTKNSNDYPNKATLQDNRDNDQTRHKQPSAELQDRTNVSSPELQQQTSGPPTELQPRNSGTSTELQSRTSEPFTNIQGRTSKTLPLNETISSGIPDKPLVDTYSTSEELSVSKTSKIPVLATESLIRTMPKGDQQALGVNIKQSNNTTIHQDTQGQQLSSDLSMEGKGSKTMNPERRNGSVRKKVQFSTDYVSHESPYEDERSRTKQSNLLQRMDVMQNSTNKGQGQQKEVQPPSRSTITSYRPSYTVTRGRAQPVIESNIDEMQNTTNTGQGQQREVLPVIASNIDEMQNTINKGQGPQREVLPPSRPTITSYRPTYTVTRGRQQPELKQAREESDFGQTTGDLKVSNDNENSVVDNSIKSVKLSTEPADDTNTKLKARFYISPFKSSRYQSPFQRPPPSLLQNFQTSLANKKQDNSVSDSKDIPPTESDNQISDQKAIPPTEGYQSPVFKSSLYRTKQNSDTNVNNNNIKTQNDPDMRQEQITEHRTREDNNDRGNVKTTMINGKAKIPPTPASKPPKMITSAITSPYPSDYVSPTSTLYQSQQMPVESRDSEQIMRNSTTSDLSSQSIPPQQQFQSDGDDNTYKDIPDGRQTTQLDTSTKNPEENQSSGSTYLQSKLLQQDTTDDGQTMRQQRKLPTNSYKTTNTYTDRIKSATNLLQKTRATKKYGLPPTAKLVQSETSDDGSYKTYEATPEELVLPSVENHDYYYDYVKPTESTVQFRPNWGTRNIAKSQTNSREPTKETNIDEDFEQENYDNGNNKTENVTKLTPPPSTIPQESPIIPSSHKLQQRPPEQEQITLQSSHLQQNSPTSNNYPSLSTNTTLLRKDYSIPQHHTPILQSTIAKKNDSTTYLTKGDKSNTSTKGDKSTYNYDGNVSYSGLQIKSKQLYTTPYMDISPTPNKTISNNNLATKLLANSNYVVMTTQEPDITNKEESDNENDEMDYKPTSMDIPDFKVKVISKFKHQESTKSLSVAGQDDAWITHDYNYIELISNSGNEKKRAKLGFNVHCVGISKSGNLILGSYGKIYRLINEKLEELVDVGTYIVHGLCNAEDNEDILVCLWAYDMGKVIRLSMKGELRQTLEFDDNGHQLFISPQYITCTPLDCDIWVTDNKTEQKSVTVTTNTGKLKFKYRGPNFRLPKPFSPRDLVATSQGRVLIADYFNQAIHVVSTDGQFLKFLLTNNQGLHQPCAVSKISDDSYWITSENDYQSYQTHLIVQCAA